MPDRTTLSLEEVQRHERWLTVLVRRLVAPCDVEDVLQDTWLAAIEQPPKRRQAWPRWLATVARNFAVARWQTRRRRRDSETLAARHEAVPSTQETVDRFATVGMLLGIVRELPEPYRTAVLLRHYHGFAVREVATRIGVTEAAARQRVKRGLDEVRRRLRERGGPSWRDRLFAVLPWSTLHGSPTPLCASVPTTAITTALGVLVMNTKMVLLLGAAGALACGVVLVEVMKPAPPVVESPATLSPEKPGSVSSSGASALAMDGATRVDRVAIELPPGPVEVAAAVWRGTVVDPRGGPIAGVYMVDVEGSRVAETDGAGRFTCPRGLPEALPRVDARFRAVRRRSGESDGEPAEELLYIVAPRVQAGGRVTTREGLPLTGVTIGVEILPLLDYPTPLEGTWPVSMPTGVSDDSSAFAFDSLPGGVCRLLFRMSGFMPSVHEVATHSDLGLQVVMEKAEGGRWLLTGRVLDTAEWLVPDAVVGLGNKEVRSDSYGRYAFELTREQLSKGGQALYAARPGYQTLVSTPPAIGDFGPSRALELDLRLPGPALTIRGTVLGPDSLPAEEAVVALWREERMPGAEFAENLAVPNDVEPHKFGIAPRRVYATAGKDGSFVLGGLRDREYRLRVLHTEYLAMTSAPVRAGATGVELRYPRDNFRTVRCRVVNTSGEPMPDLRIDTRMKVHVTKSTSSWDRVEDAHTDDEGCFEFQRVLRSEAVQVVVRGPEIITAMYMIRPDAGDECEIVVERRCHFRVECSDPRWATARIRLETDSGEYASISSARGVYNASMRLADGRTPVMTTSERATTLVVAGEKRITLSLVPGEVVVVRF